MNKKQKKKCRDALENVFHWEISEVTLVGNSALNKHMIMHCWGTLFRNEHLEWPTTIHAVKYVKLIYPRIQISTYNWDKTFFYMCRPTFFQEIIPLVLSLFFSHKKDILLRYLAKGQSTGKNRFIPFWRALTLLQPEWHFCLFLIFY